MKTALPSSPCRSATDVKLAGMRLYLSSFRMGDCPERLMELTRGGHRAVVIANATDIYPPTDRSEGVDRELTALSEIGFEATELDLREYFDQPGVSEALTPYDLVWIRGGDTFALRYSLARSGADRELTRLIKTDSLAYGGYSAGICVLAPTLRGLEVADDPNSVDVLYGADAIWDGLGVLDFCLVPHVDTPGYPENAACDQIAERYRSDGTPHRTLRDGQVLIIDGDRDWICP